ncbi:MAG: substrate-binding domain-containing protein [Verrucomicrobiota bacterium]|nr:substrate-binding domain-containing protein [Verrucomicrobiota bacterium]
MKRKSDSSETHYLCIADELEKLATAIAGKGEVDFPSARSLERDMPTVSFNTINRAIIYLLGRGVLQAKGRKLLICRQPQNAASTVLTSTMYLLTLADRDTYRGCVEYAASLGYSLEIHDNLGSIESYAENALALINKHDGPVILGVPATEVEPMLHSRRLLPKCPVVSTNGGYQCPFNVDHHHRLNVHKALTYLVEKGHRAVALLLAVDGYHNHLVDQSENIAIWKGVLNNVGLSPHLPIIFAHWEAPSDNDIAAELRNITAVIAMHEFAPFLCKRFRVPDELSVVIIGIQPTADFPIPPLTRIAADPPALGRMAIMLAHNLTISNRLRNGAPRVQSILVDGELIERRSVKKLSNADTQTMHDLQPEIIPEDYALAVTGYPSWQMLDIRPIANRGFRRWHSWLGEYPLAHFSSGMHCIHGVPFTIIPEEDNGGRSALILSGTIDGLTGLRDWASVTVDNKTTALYILCGVGWLADEGVFGAITVTMENGIRHLLPIVSRQMKDEGDLVIGDWWPNAIHPVGTHCRPHRISGPITETYSRYLYTIQWINPALENRVQTISISMNRGTQAKLGILGITALLAD